MLLQPSSLHRHVSSSSHTHSSPLPSGFRSMTLSFSFTRSNNNAIACSGSGVRSYGTVDYERRSIVKWNAVYKRIAFMENPEMGSASVLNQFENEGKKLTKWELCRIVKELRKFRKFQLALEVYEWMSNRVRISTSDTAIQLDLISKVRGIADAEDYFSRLPDNLKDGRVYGALLNAYVRAKMREKAELLLNQMRKKRYAMSSLPFNVMMTLYMNLKEYDKVESTVSEMMEKNIPLDIYSYNIWLSSRGSQGSTERMEQVFEQMKLDRTISPNWTTFSTMATMYIKLGQFERAEDCLKRVETRVLGRDRIPYHYLISLYGSTGNKEEVYRVWNIYKLNFPSISNSGYHAVISSLVRAGDFEGANKIYEDWLTVKSYYDPRIGNVLMNWYVKEGYLDRAEDFFDHMVEVGGKPTSTTWEILAEGHLRERRISEALSCFKEAIPARGSKSWRPRLANVTLLSNLCDAEGDLESKQDFMEMLREKGCLRNKAYASVFGISDEQDRTRNDGDEQDRTRDDGNNEVSEEEGAEILFSQLEGSV